MHALAVWFRDNQRVLPWRLAEAGPWGVLVSEVMLHQTPVARVIPVYSQWMERWPTPRALADASVADALRAWGRLGYPRRARNLHQIATRIVTEHGGTVPRGLEDLLALPGIGDYTARAVRCFAFGIPEPVVDTNVRRVMARAVFGQAQAGPPRAVEDRRVVAAVLEVLPSVEEKVLGAAGLMELGQTLCRSGEPACDGCPLIAACEWRKAGYPPYEGPLPRAQAPYEGSDRHVRGIILRELRSSDTPVPDHFLSSLWPDRQQYRRCLHSLVLDGLIQRASDDPESYELFAEDDTGVVSSST